MALPPGLAEAARLNLRPVDKLIVDLFAGGGGMSEAFRIALGRDPDIAINHNDDALSMHAMNHPHTRHLVADVFEVCPRTATQGRPVWWLHLSPDCTHFSQSRGGQPRDAKIRALSWVGARWAGQTLPDVISLENVPQILKWGPLIAKRDPKTGRVVTLDMVSDPATGRQVHRIAEPGERVPRERQFLVPDPAREGETWKHFVRTLERKGYTVQIDVSVAADLGGHTIRKRVFMIARRDGQPIVMPQREYASKRELQRKPDSTLKPHRPAADAIDFRLAAPSIFARKKPLAAATMRRVARGIKKFVLDNPDPFIVQIARYFDGSGGGINPVSEPLRTIAAATKGGEFAVVAPSIVPATHQGSDRIHDPLDAMPTVTGANRGELMLSAPVLAKLRAGSDGSPVDAPMPTITAGGEPARPAGHHIFGLVAPTLVQTGYGERDGQAARSLDIKAPLGTVVAGGVKHALVAPTLVKHNFGDAPYQSVDESLHAVTTQGNRFGLVAPTLVQMGHGEQSHNGDKRWGTGVAAVTDPLGTITATSVSAGLVGAVLVGAGGPEYAGKPTPPLGAITTENHRAVAAAFLAQMNAGFNETDGHAASEPMSTITNSGSQQQLVAAHLATLRHHSTGQGADEALPTLAAGGEHHAVIESTITSAEDDSQETGRSESGLHPDHEAGALRVAAFLMRYYGEGGQWSACDDAMPTMTTKDRLALVTVMHQGAPHVIVDIGMRMLEPRELFRAQDFPETYIIDRGHDGRKFSKSKQVRMVGNSVDPVQGAAYIRANAHGALDAVREPLAA
ncbi:MAG: DNA cytosine methyltransferase [Burkholderiales bacterium]|nr:DNA cytosine methyltransferase [Burkholderiales bacterium]